MQAAPGSLSSLRRQLSIVILSAVFVTAVAVAVSLASDKQYRASATLLYTPAQYSLQPGSTTFLVRDENRIQQTNLQLASLDVVADRTARRLGGGLSGGDVASDVELSPRGPSDVLSVVATAERPGLAARLANAFAGEYVAFRAQTERRRIGSAARRARRRYASLSRTQQRSRLGRDLEAQARRLQEVDATYVPSFDVIARARPPTHASSPRPLLTGALAAVLGLLLGTGLAFIRDRRTTRRRDAELAEQLLRDPA